MTNESIRINQMQRKFRLDWKGNTVLFHRNRGVWVPIDGFWTKRKLGVLMVNVLCSNKQKPPPANFLDKDFPYLFSRCAYP